MNARDDTKPHVAHEIVRWHEQSETKSAAAPSDAESFWKRLSYRRQELRWALARFGTTRTLRLLRATIRENRRVVGMRLALFRIARSATFERALDVTETWRRCHGHLSPIEQAPGMIDGELLRCPSCGERRAVRILAHVRLGARGWAAMRCMLACYACRHYNLPVHELLVPWAKQLLTFQPLQITHIDAKLWTDASLVLNLEPTTFCNFGCWYCVGRHMKQEHLSYEDFVKIIDGAPSIKLLALVGQGEPIMNKRFFDMVRYAKSKGIRIGITSNGSWFSQTNVKKICDADIDYIQISIDSADPERFARSRVDGDLEKVWDGIERLTTHRNARGLTRPVVVVRGTLFSYSQNEIPEIVREAKRRGVDAIGEFQTLNSKESYVDIYPEEMKRHLRDMDEIAKTIRKDRLRSDLPFLAEIRLQDVAQGNLEVWPNTLRKSCDIPSLYSLLSGDLTPCCNIMSPTTPSWNLTQNRLQDVLKDEQYENMRFNLWNGLYLKTCQSCRGYTLAGMAKRPSSRINAH